MSTSFEEIKNDLKTGGLVLTHGLHASSHVIEMVEESPWSHVAMIVLTEETGIDAGEESVLLWESDTQSPVKDVILGKAKSGPMLVKLSERLKYNFTHGQDSKLSIRHLYTSRTQDFFDQMRKVIPQVHHAIFPNTYHEMFNPFKGRVLKNKTSLDTLFCSELAAFTHIQLGLLTSCNAVNSYFPVYFSDKLSVGLLKRS